MASKKLKKIENTPSVKDLKAKIEEAKAAMRKHGEAALKVAFKEFFDANPEVESLRWTQYTPYFNDGEPCEFRVNDITYRLNGVTEGGDADDGYEYAWGGAMVPGKVKAFERDVADDELFEFAFDNHVQVTATRDGFEVEEYSHD